MTMRVYGANLQSINSLTLDGAVDSTIAFTIVAPDLIEFISPPGAAGPVTLTAHTEHWTWIRQNAYELVQADAATIELDGGGILSPATGVQLIVPETGIDGSVAVTFTPSMPPGDPPGEMLLDSFQIDTGWSAFGGTESFVSLNILIRVAPGEIPRTTTPVLMLFDELTGQWVVVPSQAYDPVHGLLHATLPWHGRYIVSPLTMRRYWFPNADS